MLCRYIQTIFLAIALMVISRSAFAEDKTPAAGAADFGPGQIKVKIKVNLEPAKKLEVLPFELKGALGYYASSMKDSGPGGQFRFHRPYILGNGEPIGLQLDLLADLTVYSDLHRSGRIVFAETELLGLAPIGYIGSLDSTERTHVAFSALHFGGYYAKDVHADFEFAGVQGNFIRIGLHHSLSGDADVLLDVRMFNLGMGKGEQLGKPFNFPLGVGRLRLVLGKGLGFTRLRAFVQGDSFRAPTDERGKDEPPVELSMWRFSTGVALVRLFGSPLGVSYTYGLRYFGHINWVAEGVRSEQWLGQHFLALTAEYF